MLQESDSAELRALQVKAYGRDGGLTEAEAARLRELESLRGEPGRPDRVDPGPRDRVDAPVGQGPAHELPTSEKPFRDGQAPVADASPSAPGEHADDGSQSTETGGLRAAFRQHWKAVAAASALLLVIGLGTGWALFGRSGDAVALTSAQQERRAELQAEGGFDPGSLRAIGQDEDALVWYATKDDGETVCLTLDAADKSSDQCQPAADLDNGNGIGLNASVAVPGEGDEGLEEIWASAARAMNGEVVGIIQRWRSDENSWLSQFQGDERERAEQLVQEGFEEFSFSVVGYFRDAPVWRAQRVESDDIQDCLIVDAVQAVECRPASEGQSSADVIEVAGTVVDEAGGMISDWSVRLAYTLNGMPYLVVSGDSTTATAEQTVRPGETLELGGEYQDPIQVDIPSDDSEG
ncbi:hypothetical protein SRABI98_02713 [Microbacterium sp. Bi98]|uniref:hypothetical protein n=1 Tax=unclassified Microbacterium TaxID=2609290 RepID=UPI0006F7F2E8|nr:MULTISPECIES: hypothetical protein [unclassified Microbacterium]KRD54484.1 hypothetical protein ASE34_05400 [Microbacterium sp. Root280D1]CAH0229741.1 hypothetical protein SRABI98_02713 [Microbacterium sp. Bi98]